LTAYATDEYLSVDLNLGDEKNLYIKYQTPSGIYETTVIYGEQVTIPNKFHKKLK